MSLPYVSAGGRTWSSSSEYISSVDQTIETMNIYHRVTSLSDNTFTLTNKQALQIVDHPHFAKSISLNHGFSPTSDPALRDQYAELLTKIEFPVDPARAQDFLAENGTFTLEGEHFSQIDLSFQNANPGLYKTETLTSHYPNHLPLSEQRFAASPEQTQRINQISQNSTNMSKAATPFAETPTGIITIVMSALIGAALLISAGMAIGIGSAYVKIKE